MPQRDALTASEIRRRFIDYFESRGHTFYKSSPVVPKDDPTLLFANAGMNQFKPIFLGQVDPNDDRARLRRAVNSQKCIRAGGKHNDLDDVGKDFYHHTFFEMLGNWSFGDYFKEEAIRLAWELLTEQWGIAPDRLYATFFEGSEREGLEPDIEARDIWRKYLPAERVLPGSMADNFWEMGETGPCGPCSEIHYDSRDDDQRRQTPGESLVNADHEDVIELWNLVFIQFDRAGPGAEGLRALPAKHVDTGLGLERVARILQGKKSNYDTDLFTPIMARIAEITGAGPYQGTLERREDVAYRVVADHIRALVFAIADGAEPSNKGRGYVVRRILRRAYRQGWQYLGARGSFLTEIAPTVVEMMGEFFPELKSKQDRVVEIIREEEEAFGKTLENGLDRFQDYLESSVIGVAENSLGDIQTHSSERQNVWDIEVEGEWKRIELRSHEVILHEEDNQGSVIGHPQLAAIYAFRLHDTYGFPIDLTQVMAEERGLSVDVEGFNRLMEQYRQTSRAAAAGEAGADPAATLSAEASATLQKKSVAPTDDSHKYDTLDEMSAKILAIWTGEGFPETIDEETCDEDNRCALILDQTNFYAEAGGQIGDAGSLTAIDADGRDAGVFIIEDTRASAGYILHIGRIERGEVHAGLTARLELDEPRRREIMANHTATHLLNFALRQSLGDHVEQKGSLVAPDRLRFDFSHSGPVRGEDAARIEAIVRDRITEDLPVFAGDVPLDMARRIAGARAVFGETYPDPVRVVSIGADVREAQAEPEAERWRRYSIEFCGGTHLSRTGEAVDFAVTDEEAVAKGVRRVVAVTGEVARAAIDRGEALLQRAANAEQAPDDKIERETSAIAAEVESAAIPLTVKERARSLLAELQQRAKSAKKRAAAAGRDEAVNAARRIASESQGPVIVAEVPAGSDRQALLAAMDAVRAKHEHSAIMLFSPDHEAGKVAIAASVPKAMIDGGLKAGDWVREAASACGGKGGGRPDSAQGGGTEPEKIPEAIDKAREFAAQLAG